MVFLAPTLSTPSASFTPMFPVIATGPFSSKTLRFARNKNSRPLIVMAAAGKTETSAPTSPIAPSHLPHRIGTAPFPGGAPATRSSVATTRVLGATPRAGFSGAWAAGSGEPCRHASGRRKEQGMAIDRPVPSVYAKLGVRPVIHACGTTTRYGGSLMRSETIEAMREAAQALVNLDELNEAAGAAIARMLGAEAALVTAGAAAGLGLPAPPCIS